VEQSSLARKRHNQNRGSQLGCTNNGVMGERPAPSSFEHYACCHAEESLYCASTVTHQDATRYPQVNYFLFAFVTWALAYVWAQDASGVFARLTIV
jgi:hypothetical protein